MTAVETQGTIPVEEEIVGSMRTAAVEMREWKKRQ